MISRRTFLGRASAVAFYTAASSSAVSFATPLNLPLGIQLYSVREQLAKNYEGTLAEVSGVGYRVVEAAGFFQKSAAEVKQAMQKANLRCVSSHHPFADLRQRFDEILAFNKEIGVEYLICSSPGYKDPTTSSAPGRAHTLTLDDWRWNADQFNQMGEKTAAIGIRFGYHNHVHEFTVTDGVVPYLELLKNTDPQRVTMEMDCGWVVVGGARPADLLRDHPGRFSMLHVKDFKLSGDPGADTHEPKVTELGQGSIDYRPIFQQAAKTQKIRYMFVEQEAFDMPYRESLKVDADYMRNLKIG
jgi:sugar phosphate isomerase/epimerase